MTVVAVIVGLYLVLMLGVGVIGYRLGQATPDDYFLAGRTVGPVVLFFTIIATNFSAFFFLGFAGAGYRIGYSYYGIMSFGTALVAVAFYFIGHRVWMLGRERGYITPPELIGDRMRSTPLKLIYLAVMVLFTIPYLAIQPIGAGYLLSEMTGGAIPYFWGAIGLTLCMVFYVFAGGMRSVALTDLVQGILMFVLVVIAVLYIGHALGGIGAANQRVMASNPELFTRAGGDGYFTPRRWFSFMILFFLSVPMFPQVFMRFFIPKTSRSLHVAAVLYPIVTATLFIAPVMIGVFGRITFPNLEGTTSDQILPMMLSHHAPAWIGALIMVGALAAFMSTMDSQLLALSSMITRDVYVSFFKRDATVAHQVVVGRILVVLLSIVGLAIAYQPPNTIFAIATEAFTGLAILFPTTLVALYATRTPAWSCIASIVVSQVLLIGFHYGWIPGVWSFGFLPLVPLMVISTVLVLVGMFVVRR
jgi:solute:Na+ symporter, SSS family